MIVVFAGSLVALGTKSAVPTLLLATTGSTLGFIVITSYSIHYTKLYDTHLPPEQRHIGMVFQDYALFPHLTIRDNIGFGLDALSARKRAERIDVV